MCGTCEPGFIMAIAALLKASPSPDAAQVAGIPNICRCGAYPRIRKAIARAARQSQQQAQPEPQASTRLSFTSSEKAHVPPTNST
jgi:isoquinoline 1-oxidoreductase alpha subunit